MREKLTMREKLAIANKLRVSRKCFSNNFTERRLCSKIYRAYIVECIIKGKDDFKISFGGKYIQSFYKRSLNWYNYVMNSIYRFFLIHFTPNDDKTFLKYELIHFGVSKPIHIKLAETPDEDVLYGFLEKNDFKIVDEHLYSESTVYDVAKI